MASAVSSACPGSHSTAIYDALARSGAITTVLARNEQAGAFMADGFARVIGCAGSGLHDGRSGSDQCPLWRGRGLGRLGPLAPDRRPGQCG